MSAPRSVFRNVCTQGSSVYGVCPQRGVHTEVQGTVCVLRGCAHKGIMCTLCALRGVCTQVCRAMCVT